VLEINLKSRKNGVTSFCCEAFNLRHWNCNKVSCCHLYLPTEQAVLGSFDRLFLSSDGYLILKKIIQTLDMQYLAEHSQLQTEQL
jgi:hypothetical protein